MINSVKKFKKRGAFVRIAAVLICVSAMMTVFSSCAGKAYEYDLAEYIVPGDYSVIEITPEAVHKRTEEIKNTLLKNNAIVPPAENAVSISGRVLKKGDVAVVSYQCYLESEVGKETAVPLMEDKECHIVLGNGKYFEEIENALTGYNMGAKAPINVPVTVPTDFSLGILKGKSVVFVITVNSAYELKLPVYNDEFIASVTHYSTVTEYEKALHVQVREQLVWEALLEKTKVTTYPMDEVSDHTLDFIEQYTSYATSAGVTLEQYVARKFFMDLADFHLKADEYAKRLTKEEMLVYQIARLNGLELTDEEYEAGAVKYAAIYRLSGRNELVSVYGETIVRYTVLKDKVLSFVYSQSASNG